MKHVLYLLASIIVFLPLTYSQSKTDFVNFESQWNISHHSLSSSTSQRWRFTSDSITVNNNSYFFMESSVQEVGDDWNELSYRAFRQENQKVFMLYPNDSTEVLYYDFGLETGDTLFASGSVVYSDLIVDSTDNVILSDGSERKRLFMRCEEGWNVEWIEGIGGQDYALMLNDLICATDVGASLICYSQNGETLYMPDTIACWHENDFDPFSRSLITFNSQWNLLYSSQFNGSKTSVKLRFNPNPTTNVFNYFHMETSNEENGNDWTLIETQAYREDFGKVYLYNVLDSTEILIHDFGLEVGDTFTSKQSINDPGLQLTVIAVDSLQLLDGTMKKRITLNCPSGSQIDWVEGIGNMIYPLSGTVYTCLFDVPGTLLCYSEDEETLYDSGSDTNGCWYDYESQANNLINITSTWNILTSSQFNSDLSTTIYRFDALPRIYNGEEYYQLEHLDNPADVNWQLDETYAFRENNDKVYLYNIVQNSEILIHDFSLSIGETFPSNGMTLTVTSIDSLELLDGTLRKRIKLTCELNNIITWVKGIGNINFPLLGSISSCQFEYNEQLLCYSEFGQTQYEGVNNFQSCWVTDIEEIPESEILIYPNPVRNYLYIDAENTIQKVRIYNLQGQLLLEKNEVSNIELDNLNAGIYFLHLVNNKGKELSKKIIVD